MKRLFIILSLLLATPCFAQCPEENLPPLIQLARMNVTVLGGGVAAEAPAACTTALSPAATATDGGENEIGEGSGDYYRGNYVYFASAHDVCKVIVRLSLGAGSISGKTFNAKIFGPLADAFDTFNSTTELLGTSDNVSGSNAWSGTQVTFSFSTPVSLSAETWYAVMLTMSEVDASNYSTATKSSTSNNTWYRRVANSSGGGTAGDDKEVYMVLYE